MQCAVPASCVRVWTPDVRSLPATRDPSGTSSMKGALRGLVRAPRFTVVATLTLALGIGANTAVFSVADGLLFRPLPYDNASQLVAVTGADRVSGGSTGLTVADLADYRAEPDLFAALAGWRHVDVTWAGSEAAERIRGAIVTGGMFSRVLRVQPILGRAFLPEEDRPGGTKAVVLSHDFWATRLGADPSVLGRAVTLDGIPFTVVGVMPDRFVPPFVPDARLWFPAQLEARRCRGCDALTAIGRLAPGLTLPVARDRALAVSLRLSEEFPVTNTGFELAISGLRESTGGGTLATLRMLFLGTSLVLLMACANVASLLIARSRRLTPTLSLRSALGAGPTHLATTVLVDAGLLVLLGAATAVGVAVWGTAWLLALAPESLVVADVRIDRRVLAFNTGAALVAVVLCAALPALRVAMRSWGMTARRGAGERRGDRLQASLVVAQVAFAMVLTAGAAVVVQGLQQLRSADLGFAPEGVLAMTVPSGSKTGPFARTGAWQDELLAGASLIPGVVATATTTALPLGHEPDRTDFAVMDRPPATGNQSADVRRITGSYPYVMGLRLTEGRSFSDEDGAQAVPPVIVNEAFARRYLRGSGSGALDAEIALGRTGTTWRPVVGVLRNVRASGPREPATPAIYLPAGGDGGELSILIKTDADPMELAPALRDVLHEVAPDVAPLRLAAMADLASDAVAEDRFVSALLSAFALLALTLTGIGLYGVLDQRVARGRGEIGVRLALGADRDQIASGVVRGGIGLTVSGVAIGAGAALASFGVLDGLVDGAASGDVVPFAVTASVVLLVAAVASWLPARTAGGLDPMSALRNE